MDIAKIYIAGFKYDLAWTQICVASIRYQYPDIPIFLIKDKLFGEYSTKQLEKYWNVSVFESEFQKFGWGLSKLEPLFIDKKERVLIIDSDIIIIGKLLEYLNECKADFIVRGHGSSNDFTNEQYYDIEKLKSWDQEYIYNGYGFNSGQIVATTSIFSRKDFTQLVDWNSSPPSLKNDDIFKFGDQGMINYFLLKKYQERRITLESLPFMETGENEKVDKISIKEIETQSAAPILVHWAGIRHKVPTKSPNGEKIKFFEDIYYSKIPYSSVTKPIKHFNNILISNLKKFVKFIFLNNK